MIILFYIILLPVWCSLIIIKVLPNCQMLKRFKSLSTKGTTREKEPEESEKEFVANPAFSKSKAKSNQKPQNKNDTNILKGVTSRSANNSKSSRNAEKDTKLKLMKTTYSSEEISALEFGIINHNDLKLPYGNGSEKLFGIENYGYNCYVTSIFQCLYHTPNFRRAILEYGFAKDKRRKRKFDVPGKNPDQIPQAVSNPPHHSQNQQSGSQDASNQPVQKKGFFSTNKSNEHVEQHEEPLNKMYHQDNFRLSSYQDKKLKRRLTSQYPALKKLEFNYFENSQGNVTLVGLIDDPDASLEWRKRSALIRGPIINLDHGYNEEYGLKAENMFTVLKDAFECIAENKSNTGVLSPYNLIEVLKRENIMFRNAQHQDAHEFLNFLVNNILESLGLQHSEQLITDIFEGELISETKCLSCDNSSFRTESFLDLSVDIEPDSSITNCLKLYSKIEMLNENNKFYCENCYSYQEAAKSIKLKRIPKVIAFHLKRFKYSEQLGRMVKMFYRVEYPKTLRIATTEDDTKLEKLYELYGVVVHIGGGPYHGHYVSLVKTELYGWLLFDDETIEKIDEDFVFKFFGDGTGLSTAYLLFYREIEDEDKYLDEQLYYADSGSDYDSEDHVSELDKTLFSANIEFSFEDDDVECGNSSDFLSLLPHQIPVATTSGVSQIPTPPATPLGYIVPEQQPHCPTQAQAQAHTQSQTIVPTANTVEVPSHRSSIFSLRRKREK